MKSWIAKQLKGTIFFKKLCFLLIYVDLVRGYHGSCIYNFFGKTLHNHLKKYNQKWFCCKAAHVHAVSLQNS